MYLYTLMEDKLKNEKNMSDELQSHIYPAK